MIWVRDPRSIFELPTFEKLGPELVEGMSALPLKADIDRWHREVCLVPKADIVPQSDQWN